MPELDVEDPEISFDLHQAGLPYRQFTHMTPVAMQNFLGRLPIGFNVVILSPHGFFGQANVLGKPDTGGQVRHSVLGLALLTGDTAKMHTCLL